MTVDNVMLQNSLLGQLVNRLWEMPREDLKQAVEDNSLGISDVEELFFLEDVRRAMLAGNAVLFLDGYDPVSYTHLSHLIEAAGMDENCVYYLRTDLEQLSTNMADSSEIEVKAVVNLNAVVFRQQSEGIISGIKEGPLDRKKLEELPGIVCYMVQQGDTLWDVAKRF